MSFVRLCGEESPSRAVTLSPFLIGEAEVDQAQWALVAATDAGRDLRKDPSKFKGAKLPVESVSWCEALHFANALSSLEGLKPAYAVDADCSAVSLVSDATGFRLPTGAQWEYAARAGTETDFSFGDNPADLCTFANVYDQTAEKQWGYALSMAPCDDGAAGTAATCSYRPNAWGLCDVHGNVSEWVWDTDSGGSRVTRGGSWITGPSMTRSAVRSRSEPGFQGGGIGFRLVLPAEPQP